MKKLRKYAFENEAISPTEKLSAYLNQAESLLAKRSLMPSFNNIPLATIVSLAAAGLTAIGASAQCGVAVFSPSNSVPANVAGAGNDMTIDVDGDGTIDFEVDASFGTAGGGMASFADLFFAPKNGAQIIGYAAATFPYIFATKLAANAPITSADPGWSSGAGAGNLITLDYQTNGPWHSTGMTVTGFLGVRIDGNKLGFIEVTWNNANQVTITSSLTGVQSPALAGNTSVNAGVCTALPIELVQFEAKLDRKGILLEWSTASEINNQGFEIQRSQDGVDFHKLSWVDGQGNSNELIPYSYQDENITENIQYYYRLKQIDFNGDSALSRVVSEMKVNKNDLILHHLAPNPTQDLTSIEITSPTNKIIHVNIFDSIGEKVLTTTINLLAGRSGYDLSLNELNAGIYFLKLPINDEQYAYKKLVLQK